MTWSCRHCAAAAAAVDIPVCLLLLLMGLICSLTQLNPNLRERERALKEGNEDDDEVGMERAKRDANLAIIKKEKQE